MHVSNNNIVMKINGKKRGLIEVNRDVQEDELYQLITKNEKIVKYLNKKEIKKKIYIKNRLVNLII